MAHTVFIDGEAGTTGLQIRARLEGRADVGLLRLPADRRKDPQARAEALNAADAVVLCLPDDAAREAVALIENTRVRVIDASTAHRTAPGWTYGFPELPGQREAIRASARISNPGCYPTGAVALIRPLVDAAILPADWPVTVNAVSGYSGGGKAMIAEFEDGRTTDAYRIYATGLGHKHVPEIQVYGRLSRPPLFAPAVGRFAQGMIVEVPLQLNALPAAPRLPDVHAALAAAYAGERFVEVISLEEARATKALDPEGLNGSNRLRLYVFGDKAAGQARMVALLDNLVKGASGAAVQDLNLALGLDDAAGLT